MAQGLGSPETGEAVSHVHRVCWGFGSENGVSINDAHWFLETTVVNRRNPKSGSLRTELGGITFHLPNLRSRCKGLGLNGAEPTNLGPKFTCRELGLTCLSAKAASYRRKVYELARLPQKASSYLTVTSSISHHHGPTRCTGPVAAADVQHPRKFSPSQQVLYYWLLCIFVTVSKH